MSIGDNITLTQQDGDLAIMTNQYTFNAKSKAIVKVNKHTMTISDKSCTGNIQGNLKIDVIKQTQFNLHGQFNIGAEQNINIQATEILNLISTHNNINIMTKGLFDITDASGNVTSNGYNNIGNKGNIIIRSTFGNIGIETVEDIQRANLQKPYVCVPWNPSFINEVSNSAIASSTKNASDGFEIVPKDKVAATVLADISGSVTSTASWLSYMKTNYLFDGFPSFLPCRMIMQNPNITVTKPKNTWIEDFRSIQLDWTQPLNVTYWKMVSKLIGNINISSWAGDISITTDGKLGNAGNININAQNQHGGLPGYKCGSVNISADSPKKIFTDPRDLFFDSNLLLKKTR